MYLRNPTSLLLLGIALLPLLACSPSPSTSSSGATTSTSSSGGTSDHFSFFVTSLKAMQELSGSQQGFGGDLRFGETGPDAGLRGADKICATIAETSMHGAKNKQGRAFLSAVAGADGKQVNAIDRIGAQISCVATRAPRTTRQTIAPTNADEVPTRRSTLQQAARRVSTQLRAV